MGSGGGAPSGGPGAAGSRVQRGSWEVRGLRPLKLNAFLFSRVQRKLQICTVIDICKSQ